MEKTQLNEIVETDHGRTEIRKKAEIKNPSILANTRSQSAYLINQKKKKRIKKM